MATQKAHSKGLWKDSPFSVILASVFFAACMIGTGLVINAASKEDRRQEEYSNRYYMPAVQDYNSHRYRDAIVKLQANLQAFPDDYKANFEMGLVLLKLGKKQEARAYFVNAQNSFLSHHGRFSTWERYNAAQHEINKIDQSKK